MVVRMRHTKGQRNQRRSHDALGALAVTACSNCGQARASHSVCPNCGMYRGRQVVDVAAQIARKEERRKAKAKALGEAVKKEAEE